MSTITKQEATQLVSEYFDLQTQKAEIDAKMKLRKEQLHQFANANKDQFTDNVFNLECCGYLRWGKRSVVKTTRSFSLVALVKAFPAFLKKEYSITAIKAAMDDKLTRKKVRGLGISIKQIDEFEIVRKDNVDDLPTNQQKK